MGTPEHDLVLGRLQPSAPGAANQGRKPVVTLRESLNCPLQVLVSASVLASFLSL